MIAALARAGVEPIVAADFSPTRRALATTMGAHEVVDPTTEPAIDAWRRLGARAPMVLFEAVGSPGMLDAAMRDAPRGAQILVVGVCMQPDTVRPMLAIGKELNLQFVLGYDPLEFGETLRRIAEGELDVTPLITGSVPIDGVPGAFEALAHPDAARQDPGRAGLTGSEPAARESLSVAPIARSETGRSAPWPTSRS